MNNDNQQFKDFLTSKGRKLGYLIANSTLSKEMQVELIELLPKMNLEQIDRLARIFEAKFVNEQTSDIDNDFKTRIEEMIKGFQDARDKKKEEFDKTIKNYNLNLNL